MILGTVEVTILMKTLRRTSRSSLKLAHSYSVFHRVAVEDSSECACFSCLKSFASSQIVEWVDEGTTALCPYCQLDSVLPDTCPFPLSYRFLEEMNNYYFKTYTDSDKWLE